MADQPSMVGEIVGPAGAIPILASSPARWTFTEGVQPSIGVFDVHPDHAKQLADADPSQPVTLRLFTGPNGIEIKRLFVDGVRPGPHKFIRQVRLSDRRRFLKYGVVTSRYNIKREIGVRRVVNNQNPLLNPVIPDVWYAAYSLKNPAAFPASLENKWKPLEVLEDVYKKATIIEEQYTKSKPPGLTIHPDIKGQEGQMAIEDLTVDDSGDLALDKVLRMLPEAAMTVNKDGNFVIFSRVGGGEAVMLGRMGEEIALAGHIEYIANKNTAPAKIEVFWPIEAEVRFDYVEPTDGSTAVVVIDERQLINVIPVPDWEISDETGVVAQGSIRELRKILSMWGTPPGIGGDSLTISTIRKMIPGYVDLYAAFRLAGETEPNADWTSRLAALLGHFRLTYQIPPRWMDRFLSFRPYRVGIADPVTQTRASSEAYCDYYRLGTMRSFFKNKAEAKALEFAINTPGYPNGGQVPWGVPGAQLFSPRSRPAPAGITVLNPDLGVFHLSFQPDMFRVYEVTGPGKVVLSDGSAIAGPTADFSRANEFPVTFDMVTDSARVPTLEQEFKMAVIMTAVPAAPNDLRQLYKITVKPEDVLDMFPPGARNWLKSCAGPTWQTRVSPGMQGGRAMVRWLDSRFEDTEKLFGVIDGDPDIEDMVVNRRSTELDRGQQAPNLDVLSRAIAARIWGRFADRFQGAMASYINDKVELDGWMTSVTHQIDTKGDVTTGISLPESLPILPFENLLDSSTRAILAWEAQPRK